MSLHLQELLLQGGGLLLQAPPRDSSDPPAQHGFLQQLNILITDTVIEGNVAAEGGGLWSAWPFQMSNCTIRNNTAIAAVSVSGSQATAAVPCVLTLSACLLRGSCHSFLQTRTLRRTMHADFWHCLVCKCRAAASSCEACNQTPWVPQEPP